MRGKTLPLAILTAILAAVPSIPAAQVSLDDVLTLLKAGVGEAVILKQVRLSGVDFRPGVQEIVRLKEAGATDALIEALMPSEDPAPEADRAEPEPEYSSGAGPSFRTFREVGPDGKEVIHITNLDSSGRRMGPPPASSKPSPPNQYTPREGEPAGRETAPAGAGDRYVVIGEPTEPPLIVNVFQPEPRTGRFLPGTLVSPYIYRDPYAYLYPRGLLPGYHSPRIWCPVCPVPAPPGSYSHFRRYHTHYGGPAPAPAGESDLGPRYFPIGPASGPAALQYLRSQVRLGGSPSAGAGHRSRSR